jgi:hypothetical protein
MPSGIELTLDTTSYKDGLNLLITEMPQIARKMMRRVNAEVKKQVRREINSRGYKTTRQKSWGESAITKNLFSFENSDFTGKLMIGRNAFQARFIEYGAHPIPRHSKYLCFIIDGKYYRTKGFSLPAKPFLHPIADRIWQSGTADTLMDETMQKELDRMLGR